jgi:hypothetical protein
MGGCLGSHHAPRSSLTKVFVAGSLRSTCRPINTHLKTFLPRLTVAELPKRKEPEGTAELASQLQHEALIDGAVGSKPEVAALRRGVCFTPDCVEKLENCGAPKISQM